jgi:hypothetical protein
MRLRVLVSFHYHRDTDLDALVADLGGDVDLFADSGAYSAWSTGAQIDVEDYTAWLHRWGHLLSTRANLDVIGDPTGTARNQEILTGHGLDVLPVFHTGEPFVILEQLCEAHPYVALGGLVPYLAAGRANSNRSQLMAWMVKAHLTARKRGAVLHGFGCTGSLFARDLPFYSLDSSSYVFGRKMGLAYLWDEKHMVMRSVHIRDQAHVRRRAHLFRAHGLEPGLLLHPEFMRPDTDHFDEDRIEIVTAGIRAYRMMERTLSARHTVASPNGTDIGTKIYFVNTDTSHVDVEPLRRAAREEN